MNTGPGTARSTYRADTDSNHVPPVINSKTSYTQRWLIMRKRADNQVASRMMSPVIKKSRDRSEERNTGGAAQQVTINSGGARSGSRPPASNKPSTVDGEALRVFKAVSPGLDRDEHIYEEDDAMQIVSSQSSKNLIQMNVNLK